MSADLSGEITAYATVALAVLAFATAILAALAFRKQSREVAMLAGERERELSDRHRDQASRVFIWVTPDYGPEGPDQEPVIAGLTAHIKNTSQRPVYEGGVRFPQVPWQPESSTYYPAFPALMPGDLLDTSIGFLRPSPGLMDDSRLHARLHFRDAAGVHWQLGTDGQLEEMPAPKRQEGGSLSPTSPVTRRPCSASEEDQSD